MGRFPKQLCSGLVFLLLVLLMPASAGPTYCFERITSNTPEGYALPVIEIMLDPYEGLPDSGQEVLFTFTIAGPGSIAEIYFDDEALLAAAQILDAPPYVSFEFGANPSVLPGGNELAIPFEVNQSLSVQASGKSSTGIQNGETLGLVYRLQNDFEYEDILNALSAGVLRVGLHVRSLGLEGEESDSFIVGPPSMSPAPSPVPAPGAIMLGTVGLMFVGWLRRRKTI